MFDGKSCTSLSPVELRMPRELGGACGESRVELRPLLLRRELLILTGTPNAGCVAICIRNQYTLGIFLIGWIRRPHKTELEIVRELPRTRLLIRIRCRRYRRAGLSVSA